MRITQEKLTGLRYYANIPIFAKELLPEHVTSDIPAFHRDLYDIASDMDNPRKCVVIPRGFAKTTCITLIYLLHEILFHPKRSPFIVIVSDSHHQARLFLEAISSELEHNERITSLFGRLATDQWSQDSITTTTGVRVIAKGSGQKLRGLKFGAHRPALIIMDDCENDELVSTPEQRAKLKHWFYAAVLPALAKDGRIIMVGTILHEDSLLNNVYERDKSFKRIKYAALSPTGESLWPAYHPAHELRRERERLIAQGLADVWAQEYMCQAVNPDTAEFKPHLFKRYDPAHLRGLTPNAPSARPAITVDNVTWPLNVTMALDPSLGESRRSDYSAIVTLGSAPDGHTYLLDVVRRRLRVDELIRALFDKVRQYQPLHVAVETNGFQALLAREIYDTMRRCNVHFRIEEFRSTMNKEVRIRSLSPPLLAGTLLFPSSPIGDSADLESELSMFPRANHDDASDALEAAFRTRIAPRQRLGRSLQRKHYQPSSAIGGY